MARENIDDLLRYLVEAAAGFPGAVRASAVPGEPGVFSVELENGVELFVAIAAVTT
ncbi:hypothetical protein [Spirillospora sp. NPDC029432]|uniref:hypothetical protein n=1 Tax=Spirillospora sp. NPDC029432 TaxID=3154599 RepID=UPI003452FB28